MGTWPRRFAALLALAALAVVAWILLAEDDAGGPADSGEAEVETPQPEGAKAPKRRKHKHRVRAKPDPKSGVEAKIIALQRTERGPSAAVLKKEAADIIKLAEVNMAMAEIAKPYFTKAAEGKGKKDWDKWLDEQKKASEDLIKAVKASDSKAVAKAAKELLASCTDCHSVFR